MSCKIFKENEEVTSGYITSGMSLKLYYKEDLIDSYDIIVDIKEYVDLGNVKLNGEDYYLRDMVADYILDVGTITNSNFSDTLDRHNTSIITNRLS